MILFSCSGPGAGEAIERSIEMGYTHAAVAGGLAESFVLWGIVAMVVSQVAAIFWLSRSFSNEHLVRSLVSALSICLSVLMLALTCFLLWFAWFQARH